MSWNTNRSFFSVGGREEIRKGKQENHHLYIKRAECKRNEKRYRISFFKEKFRPEAILIVRNPKKIEKERAWNGYGSAVEKHEKFFCSCLSCIRIRRREKNPLMVRKVYARWIGSSDATNKREMHIPAGVGTRDNNKFLSSDNFVLLKRKVERKFVSIV